MSTVPRPPLLRRLPPRVRTVLVWCGVGAFPVLLCGTVLIGGNPGGDGLPGLRYLLPLLTMAMAAGLLRRRPLTALGMMLFALAVVTTAVQPLDGGYLWNVRIGLLLATDLAVGFIAAGRRRRTSVIAVLLTLVVQLCCAVYVDPQGTRYGYGHGLPTNAVFIVLALAVVWQVGHSIRQRREYTEARRAQAAVQAVQAERLRIARELHDMIAHSIGVIAIQAGVGGRVIETQPAEARNALNAIEDTSRETLTGLRRMLGALRRAEPGSVPLNPSPGLAELDGLVGRSLHAGVRVDVRRLGRERALPADIDLSAFRIIQESVTNVIRHAGAQECRVSLDYREEELSIEVTDEGRGGAEPEDGYGIAGMRERVGLLHGHFSAGPRPEGGFRVSARLPVPAGVR
jgi:signal transduction histidine kinase